MRPFCMMKIMLLAALCAAQTAFSQGTNKKAFEAKVYSIEAISHFGLDDHRFSALTDIDKQNLIDSRNDLLGLLRAVQTKGDALQYVTIEMGNKYRNSTALAASLLDPETTILAAGISDFTILDRGSIKFRLFVVVFSDGDIVISEKSASLKKTDSGWRVAGFQ